MPGYENYSRSPNGRVIHHSRSPVRMSHTTVLPPAYPYPVDRSRSPIREVVHEVAPVETVLVK